MFAAKTALSAERLPELPAPVRRCAADLLLVDACATVCRRPLRLCVEHLPISADGDVADLPEYFPCFGTHRPTRLPGSWRSAFSYGCRGCLISNALERIQSRQYTRPTTNRLPAAVGYERH